VVTEPRRELDPRGRDELALARRDLEPELELLELLGEARGLLVALGELALQERDPALEALEIRLALCRGGGGSGDAGRRRRRFGDVSGNRDREGQEKDERNERGRAHVRF
jgi:hypothetical protein